MHVAIAFVRRSIPSHHCTSHRPSHLPSCAEAAASQVVSKVEVPGPSILGFFMPRSSSSGMPRDSNGAPMVDVKEQVSFSLDGLAVAWDNDPLIRERLRSDGGHLLKTYDAKLKQAVDGQIEIKVENLRVNACILSPLFKMMSQNEGASPCVEKLQLQVADLFNRAKVVYTKHGDRVYQDSWAIKRLCTLGKSQQFRGSPPKENIKTKNVLLYITCVFIYIYIAHPFPPHPAIPLCPAGRNFDGFDARPWLHGGGREWATTQELKGKIHGIYQFNLHLDHLEDVTWDRSVNPKSLYIYVHYI